MTEEKEYEPPFWYLRNHDFFREVSNRDIKQLCIIVGFKKAQKGDMIFFSDIEEPRIFFLKKGAIKIISTNEDGEEVIHHILRKGDLFGQFSLEEAQNTEEYAVALTDRVVICSFLKSDFEELMLRKPDLALKYSKFIGLRYKRIANNYNNLFFKSAKSRLAGFLADWAQREGIQKDDVIEVENYLTQNDLSQVICTKRQTCTSLLNELKSEGLIDYDRKTWFIKNLKKLRNVR